MIGAELSMVRNARKVRGRRPYLASMRNPRPGVLIQVGLTASVVVFAVALVTAIVVKRNRAPAASDTRPIRVATSEMITKEGSDAPKVRLELYEDFLCPACGRFEQNLGPTVNRLIDTGAVAADYYMVSILDRPLNQNYSTRAGNAAYCVADSSPEAFRRFHEALYRPDVQPDESGATFPGDAFLIDQAVLAGVVDAADCIKSGRYSEMVRGQAAAAVITRTPTIRINGEEYTPNTPEDLIAKVEQIGGTIPALNDGTRAP